jgi:hypothetical protein
MQTGIEGDRGRLCSVPSFATNSLSHHWLPRGGLAHNTRRYEDPHAGVPGLSGRPGADFHGAVTFALSRFSEIRIQQCGDFRCSTSLNATFDGT